ncbi:MAG: hypothetical protein HY871_00520 [Chloroflexi bacterium]|nr:hypothetical protein [Chloroflexota bacterium]
MSINKLAVVFLTTMSILGWAAWLYLINNAEPSDASARLLFFVFLVWALLPTLSVAFYLLSIRLNRDEYTEPSVWASLRRGLLVTTLVTVSAWLLLLGALNRTNFVLLVGVALFIELFFWLKR